MFQDERSMPAVPHATVVEGFAARMAATPDAVALVCGGRTLTYRELDRRAAELRGRPGRTGGGRGVPGGAAAAARSAEVVVAMLAVLKAGAVYVVLHQGEAESVPPHRSCRGSPAASWVPSAPVAVGGCRGGRRPGGQRRGVGDAARSGRRRARPPAAARRSASTASARVELAVSASASRRSGGYRRLQRRRPPAPRRGRTRRRRRCRGASGPPQPSARPNGSASARSAHGEERRPREQSAGQRSSGRPGAGGRA